MVSIKLNSKILDGNKEQVRTEMSEKYKTRSTKLKSKEGEQAKVKGKTEIKRNDLKNDGKLGSWDTRKNIEQKINQY